MEIVDKIRDRMTLISAIIQDLDTLLDALDRNRSDYHTEYLRLRDQQACLHHRWMGLADALDIIHEAER